MQINDIEKISKIADQGYWGQRILGELKYAARLSQTEGNKFDKLIDSVLQYLKKEAKDAIKEEHVRWSEERLAEMEELARQYTMLCAGHAHIDMNWQWRWDETVSITIDTFRTVLELMEEYPDFKFSQSQASVYRIMENYAPEMLEKIRQRVQEGRWEVTASTWVEADKNVSGGESMVKHLLYTKRYLADLLDIAPSALDINFEPDTFGHSFNVPEVLNKGGIKYYYHCRGYDGHNLYRWQGKSGRSVLVNREGAWYNDRIVPEMAERVPGFCSEHGLDYLLKVYGVGDHGGGPTRRDLERLEDMQKWPVFPVVKFGTFREYFQKLEEIEESLPVVNDELNFVFTGCYSSQSRIKKGNRKTENKLVDAEIYSTLADLIGGYSYNNEDFFSGWEKTLLNQFHDILPGSGTRETRQHAMGLYQESLAVSGSKRNLALNSIVEQIDTTSLLGEEENAAETVSEGAGVGFGVEDYQVAQTSRGRGDRRVFHVFNSAPEQRHEIVEFVVWDWPQNEKKIEITDTGGRKVAHQVISSGRSHYWGHEYLKVLVEVQIPPLGYSSYVLQTKEPDKLPPLDDHNPRIEEIDEFCLENEKIRAEFDPRNGALVSLVDKESGLDLIAEEAQSVFRLIDEDDNKGMTSWIVGRYMNIEPLDHQVKIKELARGQLRNSLQITASIRNSKLKVVISLDKNSSQLDFQVECDWQEKGEPGHSIPQLNYRVPLAYDCQNYKYDIPFGTIERKGMRRDVPASSFALGVPAASGKKALQLITGSRHGFRCKDSSLAVTLLRSSYDPDPYPELGEHKFSFALNLTENEDHRLLGQAYNYNHPLEVVSGSRHTGKLPAEKSFIQREKGAVILSDIKVPEQDPDGDSCIIRLFETAGQNSETVLKLFAEPREAYFVDLNERKSAEQDEIKITGDTIHFTVEPYSIASVLIKF